MRIKILKNVEFNVKFNPDVLFERAAQIVKRNIRDRTQKRKVDVYGKKFKEYSDRYEIMREKTGKNTVPDLTWSGRMLNSLRTIKKTSNSVEIGFTGEELKKAAANNKRREFMGIDKQTDKEIDKVIEDFITEQLESGIIERNG